MFVLRAVLFVVLSIIGSTLLPFLAVQYPLVFLLVVAVGIYVFSRSFSQRKRA